MNNSIFVDINQIQEIMNKNEIIIDLRDSIEYDQLHIKGSINIPYEEFYNHKSTLKKDQPIYLICYSGNKSKSLALVLRNEGYEAYSFQGGFYTLTHQINNSYY